MINAILFAALSVTATFTRPDGTTYTRALEGAEGAEKSRVYTIPKAELAAVKTVRLAVDGSESRSGEGGFALFERGIVKHFRERNFRMGRGPHWLANHYLGVSTPRMAYVGIVDSLEFEMHVIAEGRDGVCRAWLEWRFPEILDGAYEDIVYTVYELPAGAGYVPMAKVYRRHFERKHPDLKPIDERVKTQPSLAKLRKSIALRQICARKWPRETNASSKFDVSSFNVNFCETNEPPVHLVKSFAETLEDLKALKAAGVDDVALCLAGWQTGGYDGRCPASFPVESVAGGERELRRLLAGAQALGYIVDAHNNYTDSFTCSPEWHGGDVVCQKPDGTLCENKDFWDGGKPYDTCIKAIADTLIYRDLRRCRDLGFNGCAYIDVFTAAWPYRCSNPRHPATRRDTARLQIEIAKFCRRLNGGFSGECCFDHLLPYLDYINYAQCCVRGMRRANRKGRSDIDDVVPFFELAFHDVVLSNPDKVTQEIPVGADRLLLWEFGGRPITYYWERKDIPALKELYDEFAKLRHLQGVEMTDHKRFANGVARTSFANGQRLYLNYNPCTEQTVDGVRVPAFDWVLK